MKILILNYEYPPIGGGAANATFYLLKEFSKNQNIEIDLVTSSPGRFKIEKPFSNITIHFLDIGKNNNLHYQTNKELLKYSLQAQKYSKKLVKKNNFDMIHAFFGIPCGYIAMKLKLPYIVSLRGSDVPFYNKRFEKLDKLIFKRLSKKIWKKAGFVAANSAGLKKLANKSVPDQEISVIYNGIDTDEFVPDFSKKTAGTIKLVSTGRLIQRKGYSYLIDALKGLDDFSLQLIGYGNLTDDLKKQAENNRVNVEFTGKIDHKEIAGYLKKADIFILPSLNEGMSNSVLEAMACGLPVIATDVGGSNELISDNGFIVKKADSNDLREALLVYSNNRDLITAHGVKSRETAEKMSWFRVAKEYFELYKACI